MSIRRSLYVAAVVALALGAAACKRSAPAADAGLPPPPPAPKAAPDAGAAATSADALPPAPAGGPSWQASRALALLPPDAAAACLLSLGTSETRLFAREIDRLAPLFGFDGRAAEVRHFFGLGLLDPFDPVARGVFGISDSEPMAFAMFPGGNTAVAAFPVRDGALFAAELRKRLAKQGVEAATANVAGASILVGRLEGRSRIALLQRHGFAILVPGGDTESPESLVEKLLAGIRRGGLRASPTFRTSTAALHGLGAAVAYFDGAALRDMQLQGVSTDDDRTQIRHFYDLAKGFGVGIELREEGLRARAVLQLGDPASWAALFPAPTADAELLEGMPGAALLYARTSADPRAVARKIFSLDGRTDPLDGLAGELEKQYGIKARALLAALAGPLAVAVTQVKPDLFEVLEKKGLVAGLGRLHARVAALVRDPAAAKAALRELASSKNEGLRIESGGDEASPKVVLRGGGASLALTLRGRVLLASVGEGKEGEKAPPMHVAAKTRLAMPGHLAVHLDVEAWSRTAAGAADDDGAPEGLAALALSLRQLTRELGGTLAYQDGALVLDLDLRAP